MYDSGEAPVDYAKQARRHGLRYVTDLKPGIRRQKRGKHFLFFDPTGERIRDAAEIARIRSLAIPPAYRQVWICPNPNGHIQATGIDARGRKQYRYHANWRLWRDDTKFSHILNFAEALPALRAIVHEHMSQRGLSRDRVLATVVALLDKTLIRVGNAEYSRANQSFGLTTLRDDHVDVTGNTIRFHFLGKSGKTWNLSLNDRRIARVVKACADIDGQELFKYIDDNGVVRDVTSGDVNAYLREVTGQPFTAKDFRTWAATVLAAVALQNTEYSDSPAQQKRQVRQAVEAVAKKLGNTPAVCRKAYIHPEIVNAWCDGRFGDIALTSETNLQDAETCVLQFLKDRLN